MRESKIALCDNVLIIKEDEGVTMCFGATAIRSARGSEKNCMKKDEKNDQ